MCPRRISTIDEVFIDVTGYLPYYHMSAHDLAMTLVREVLYNTGITATAGIGTNLYLAKLAMPKQRKGSCRLNMNRSPEPLFPLLLKPSMIFWMSICQSMV